MAYILPKVGEVWLDQNGHRNLILREKLREYEYFYTLQTLETGETWDSERESNWNKPYRDGS